MATFYSVEATKFTTPSVEGFVRGTDLGGKLRVSFFTYNFAGTEATNDTIVLTKVPQGARILGVYVANEDCGTTVTVDIGDSDDTDRLVDDAAWGTAAAAFATLRRDDTETDETPTLGFGYRYSAETNILATLASVSTPTANATVRGYVMYAVE